MALKKGLGRGLGSLIDGAYDEPVAVGKAEPVVKEVVKEVIKEVKVNEPLYIKTRDIEPNRNQPRKDFDEEAMGELADSIKQYGVIEPLILKKEGKRYVIIAGERRWRAAKLAGVKEVPAVIKEYSEQEITEIALIENIQREDLNPVEEAMGYKRLTEEFGLKQDDVASKVSKSRAAISNSMRLLKLPESVLAMLSEGQISTGHAKVLLELESDDDRAALAEQIVERKLSVRETEKMVKLMQDKKPEKEKKILSNPEVYKTLEERLKGSLNTKVSIKRRDENKGKIEIDYYSLEELENIIGKIM